MVHELAGRPSQQVCQSFSCIDLKHASKELRARGYYNPGQGYPIECTEPPSDTIPVPPQEEDARDGPLKCWLAICLRHRPRLGSKAFHSVKLWRNRHPDKVGILGRTYPFIQTNQG